MRIGRYIVGLLSGLTFGILFAPKKGKKLREELFKKGSKSGQDALATLVEAFKDAGMDAVTEVKRLSENEQISTALSMSKDRMREYLSQLEETGYDVAAKAQEKLEELSEVAAETTSAFKKRAVRKKKAAIKKVKKAAKAVRSEAKKVTRKARKAVPKKVVRKKK